VDAASPPDALLDRLRIVLVAPSHPGNIGASARAMSTMGIARLVLVNPHAFPIPMQWRARPARRASSIGLASSVRLPKRSRLRTGDRTFIATARVCRARCAGACRRERAIAHAAHGDVALVFGSEMSGLSNDDLARCA
jgi:tRNA/rRNA methyltransferase